MKDFPEILYIEVRYEASVYENETDETMPIYRVRRRAYGNLMLYAFQTDKDGGPYVWLREENGRYISCVPPQSLKETLKDIDAFLERVEE